MLDPDQAAMPERCYAAFARMKTIGFLLRFAMAALLAPAALAVDAPPVPPGAEITPPRLSFVDGSVSFRLRISVHSH